MKKIKLTQGKFALVDDDDYKRVNCFKWQASKTGDIYYALRHYRENGRYKYMSMHNLILGDKKGFCIDHKNRNGLDNRKSNLRYATTSQNAMNKKKALGGTSKYKGVSWHKPLNKWRTNINVNGEIFNAGYFSSEIDAALMYDMMSIFFFKDFARNNNLLWRGTNE